MKLLCPKIYGASATRNPSRMGPNEGGGKIFHMAGAVASQKRGLAGKRERLGQHQKYRALCELIVII